MILWIRFRKMMGGSMRDEGGIMVPVGEVEGEGEVAVVVGVVAVVVMVVVEEGAFLSVL